MTEKEPVTELTAFSTSDAKPVQWSSGRTQLQAAPLYWLSTVRPTGSPHVTPLIGVWWEGALYIVTGAEERKAKNLASNPRCVLTTGTNSIDQGLDLAVEGSAEVAGNQSELDAVADAFETKYGAQFLEPDGTWFGLGGRIRAGEAQVYRVVPTKVFGWEKGRAFGETRWQFTT
ncbi:pyridoxamine 5'-phosphate oxidase family protein [Kribbella sp. NPDC020789]